MKLFRRVLLVVAVLLMLGAIGVVASDKPLRGGVERSIATQLAAGVDAPVLPEVSLSGWPFAWHLLLRSFPRAELAVEQLTVETEAGPLTLKHLDMHLGEVRMLDDGIYAGSVNGTVLVPWDSIMSLAGYAVGDGGDGRMRVEVAAEVLGMSLRGGLTGVPELDEETQTVTIVQPEVEILGMTVPQSVTDWVVSQFVPSIPIELPYGLRTTSLEVRESGLNVGVAGAELTMTEEG